MEQNNSVLYLLSALCHISTYMRISFCSLECIDHLRTLSLSYLLKGSDDKRILNLKPGLVYEMQVTAWNSYRRGQQIWVLILASL